MGLPRSEVRALLKPELPADPKEAFAQIWKQRRDGWYAHYYSEEHHLGYIMHESKTLKLNAFFR